MRSTFPIRSCCRLGVPRWAIWMKRASTRIIVPFIMLSIVTADVVAEDKYTIGVIGTGNMGSALGHGLDPRGILAIAIGRRNGEHAKWSMALVYRLLVASIKEKRSVVLFRRAILSRFPKLFTFIEVQQAAQTQRQSKPSRAHSPEQDKSEVWFLFCRMIRQNPFIPRKQTYVNRRDVNRTLF